MTSSTDLNEVETNVLVEGEENQLGDPVIIPVAVDEQQFPEEAELRTPDVDAIKWPCDDSGDDDDA